MQTLLIVDDEPNIVEGLASQFQQRYGDSVQVLKSFSGQHALSVLRNNKVDVCFPTSACLTWMVLPWRKERRSYGRTFTLYSSAALMILIPSIGQASARRITDIC